VNPQASTDYGYTFGRTPNTYLAPREIVRLTILRSRLQDRHALRNRVMGARRRRRSAQPTNG
jgi:hypothetical protein